LFAMWKDANSGKFDQTSRLLSWDRFNGRKLVVPLFFSPIKKLGSLVTTLSLNMMLLLVIVSQNWNGT